ncbi:hypothetical protein PG993_003951 [Apiospora rasikravindrae]|uniref:Uncharacterized protein n=1 Tax=Apiospora rasikravindrae TaxID=990691 RepID=A0ABR1U375_9PEZI
MPQQYRRTSTFLSYQLEAASLGLHDWPDQYNRWNNSTRYKVLEVIFRPSANGKKKKGMLARTVKRQPLLPQSIVSSLLQKLKEPDENDCGAAAIMLSNDSVRSSIVPKLMKLHEQPGTSNPNAAAAVLGEAGFLTGELLRDLIQVEWGAYLKANVVIDVASLLAQSFDEPKTARNVKGCIRRILREHKSALPEKALQVMATNLGIVGYADTLECLQEQSDMPESVVQKIVKRLTSKKTSHPEARGQNPQSVPYHVRRQIRRPSEQDGSQRVQESI